MIRILWSGITGKTGKMAYELSKDMDNLKIVAGLSRMDEHFYKYDELYDIKEEYDIIIDFSHKDVFDDVLRLAIDRQKPIIIGTSGLSEEQEKKIKEAANIIPVFRGGNFRLEVKRFIDEIVNYAESYDEEKIELTEIHYKTMNVPSETAKVIKSRVLEETGKEIVINSSLQDKENTNYWQVGDICYKCPVYDEKIIEDIFTIAEVMSKKEELGLYDLDCLFKEGDIQ